ncbi:MAG: bifunctional hydroxymethylpyrimidine kinase/phosphomethylpyrimidine kinase [Rhizobiales bacterium]|nr:PfkB family carbohydrate kinase [Hyphomicrobiales bacterium]NRB15323.1 bifunctional hydroxymethylpyrimidine kinase/phosphomethylpyrimidine kinase [Hyphomicrobiales bacterium]
MIKPDQTDHIIVIGGANADITGIATAAYSETESNIGKLTVGAGGVGRNIADNFARLARDSDIKTYFLSALGTDIYGDMILAASQQAGIDMRHCQIVPDQATATYLSIIDDKGEMRSAINDMSIVKHINIDYLKQHDKLLNQAKLIIFDANLNQQTIDYICQNFNHIAIFADSVSNAKADKLNQNLNHIHTLSPNKNEAFALTGINPTNANELCKMAKIFHHQGLKNIFITLGSNGVFSSTNISGQPQMHQADALAVKPKNANGAGDAFLAGLAFAWLQKLDPESQVYFAQKCACLALESEFTINPTLCLQKVLDYTETKL